MAEIKIQKCPVCGTATINGSYCPKCGAWVEETIFKCLECGFEETRTYASACPKCNGRTVRLSYFEKVQNQDQEDDEEDEDDEEEDE